MMMMPLEARGSRGGGDSCHNYCQFQRVFYLIRQGRRRIGSYSTVTAHRVVAIQTRYVPPDIRFSTYTSQRNCSLVS